MAQTRGALEQRFPVPRNSRQSGMAVQIEDQLQQAYQIPLGMAAQLKEAWPSRTSG